MSQTWTATLGDHKVRAFADRFGVVPESNEGNNDLVESLPGVLAPDLVISEITTSPSENLVDGQQGAIAATVTNAGSGDLPGSFLMRFEIDGDLLAQELISGGLSEPAIRLTLARCGHPWLGSTQPGWWSTRGTP